MIRVIDVIISFLKMKLAFSAAFTTYGNETVGFEDHFYATSIFNVENDGVLAGIKSENSARTDFGEKTRNGLIVIARDVNDRFLVVAIFELNDNLFGEVFVGGDKLGKTFLEETSTDVNVV